VFVRLDPSREDLTRFAESEKLQLENIQFIYVAKGMIVLEQVQDKFASPEKSWCDKFDADLLIMDDMVNRWIFFFLLIVLLLYATFHSLGWIIKNSSIEQS